jgi:PAS domain S-box-containing protein
MSSQDLPLILIVDDDADNFGALFRALGQANFEVLSAEDGETALEMVRRTRPDLILLDILLNGLDGYEICRRLKANKLTEDIPVIFITELADSVDKVKGFQAGAADYVTKPLDLPEVIARINTHLTVHRLQTDLRKQNAELQAENEKRRRVQDALRESRERYRLLAENSTDIIARQTLSGNYLYVSPACYPLLGYKIEEMIGRSVFDFIHPDDLEMAKNALQPGDDCPSSVTVTFRTQRKNGSYIWLETTSRTVCDSEIGTPYEMVSVSRDVTERIELTRKLQEQNKELDAFAHTVAHDLKNPFGIIASTIDFLLDMGDRLPTEQTNNFLQNIRSTSEKGIEIIRALLLLANIRTEEVTLEPIDMAAILAQAKERLSLTIERSAATIVAPDNWPPVLGYAPWVEEIWVNYLSNGLKYGGSPPYLELGAVLQPDGFVKFWVTDNGEGIPPEDQTRLFAEFVRLEVARGEGHGLGLSIVRRITDKLGGTVGMDSQLGEGSTFYFTLPAAPDSG